MSKVIEEIGKKVLEFIYDFDNNGFVPESGYYDGEDYVMPCVSICSSVRVFGHEATVSLHTGKGGWLDVLFENDEYENIESAVSKYVAAGYDENKLINNALEYDRI